MKEIWKPIPNMDGLFEVSSKGRVRSLGRFCPAEGRKPYWINGRLYKLESLKRPNGQTGYHIKISYNRKLYRFYISKLVYCVFFNIEYNSIPESKEVCHLNKIESDNRVENLDLIDKTISHQKVHEIKGLSDRQKTQYSKQKKEALKKKGNTCRKCGRYKLWEGFYFPKNINGDRNNCKDCLRKQCNINDRKRRSKS